MNHIPKKTSPPVKEDEEEDVWDDLPPTSSFDAEDEWTKEGSESVRITRAADGLNGEEVLRLHVDRPEGSGNQYDSPVPPDARLSAEDLPSDDSFDPDAEEADKQEKAYRGSIRWLIYSGMSVIAVIVAAVGIMILTNQATPKVNPLGTPNLVIDLPDDYPMGERIADLLARKDEAIALYERFLRVASTEELLAMVRKEPGIEALVGDAPRRSNVPPGWRVSSDARWDVHTDNDPIFAVLSGYDSDGEKFQAFMTLEHGRLILDWKATVCYSSTPFDQLAAGKGDGSEVRVWVEPATFYSAAFPERDYRSYKIHTKLDDVPVWAFARRETVADQELSKMFQKSMFEVQKHMPTMVVLDLERGPAEVPNQWLITDVLHTAWILP